MVNNRGVLWAARWGLLCLAVALGLCGCEGGQSSLPGISGAPGQVLVVSAVPVKDSPLGDTLRAVLGAEYPYIPQSEPSFDLSFITESAFENVLRPFRNIVWVQTHPDSACRIRVAENRWAQSQVVLYVLGPDHNAVAAYLGEHREVLYQSLARAERMRLARANRASRQEELCGFLRSKHGVELVVPKTYALRADKPGFTWLSVETKDISQGLFVYSWRNWGQPFSVDTLMAHRNWYTSHYVPGPNDGTYMEVSTVVPPEATLLRMGGDTLLRVRGFWEVHGHAMGGAFVSYSQLVVGGDSVRTTEGYIYAPSKRKREYMRQLEAILLSQLGNE